MGTEGLHFERDKSLSQYIRDKERMLENDFMIKLRQHEWCKLYGCKTEDEVDQVAHDIFMNRL